MFNKWDKVIRKEGYLWNNENKWVEKYNILIWKWEMDKDFQITYIKEKYWSLRFEVTNSNEEINRLITECELVSEWICWRCWKIWRIRYDRNWYMCLCDDCNFL